MSDELREYVPSWKLPTEDPKPDRSEIPKKPTRVGFVVRILIAFLTLPVLLVFALVFYMWFGGALMWAFNLPSPYDYPPKDLSIELPILYYTGVFSLFIATLSFIPILPMLIMRVRSGFNVPIEFPIVIFLVSITVLLINILIGMLFLK